MKWKNIIYVEESVGCIIGKSVTTYHMHPHHVVMHRRVVHIHVMRVMVHTHRSMIHLHRVRMIHLSALLSSKATTTSYLCSSDELQQLRALFMSRQRMYACAKGGATHASALITDRRWSVILNNSRWIYKLLLLTTEHSPNYTFVFVKQNLSRLAIVE